MKKKKNGKLETILIVFGMIICVIVTVGGWFVRQDYLFGQTADGFIIRQRVRPGTPVTLVYRHSVQKTMIHEYLEVNDMATGLVLKSTKYQSMGVGLPFSKEDGDFREEDGYSVTGTSVRAYYLRPGSSRVIDHGYVAPVFTIHRLSEAPNFRFPLVHSMYLFELDCKYNGYTQACQMEIF